MLQALIDKSQAECQRRCAPDAVQGQLHRQRSPFRLSPLYSEAFATFEEDEVYSQPMPRALSGSTPCGCGLHDVE
jgi:hypothetical protein